MGSNLRNTPTKTHCASPLAGAGYLYGNRQEGLRKFHASRTLKDQNCPFADSSIWGPLTTYPAIPLSWKREQKPLKTWNFWNSPDSTES